MKLEERYNHYQKLMRDSDHIIWQYMMGHREACAAMTIGELAKACAVSKTTVLRFAKKLGFLGYAELKVTLRQETKRSETKTSNINAVIRGYNDAITRTHRQNYDDLFKAMDEADHLFIYGTGMVQSTVARELTRIFLYAKVLFFEIKGRAETSHVLEGITPRDMVFLVSYSGDSPEALSFAKKLVVRGVPIVSFTTLHENTLAKLSDYNLYIKDPHLVEDTQNSGYSSVTGFFILVEMLFLKYKEYREKKEVHCDS